MKNNQAEEQVQSVERPIASEQPKITKEVGSGSMETMDWGCCEHGRPLPSARLITYHLPGHDI